MAESSRLRAFDLRRLLFAVVGGALLVVILFFALAAWNQAEQVVEPAVERQLSERSSSAVTVIESFVESATTDVELLALSPAVVEVVLDGAERSRQLGLDQLTGAEAERRMSESRSLGIAPEADRYFRQVVERSLFDEILVTDVNGFVAASAADPPNFVLRETAWWQAAAAGRRVATRMVEEVSGAIALSVALPVRTDNGRVVGVLKALLNLGRLRPALAELARGWGYVQVMDERGFLIIDPHEEHLLTPHPDPGALVPGQLLQSVAPDGERIVGMARPALEGWTVVYWVPATEAFDLLRAARRAVAWGTLIALVTALVGIMLAGAWVTRQVGRPISTVAAAADRVGGGDLRVRVPEVGKGEVLKLCSAVQQMIDRLRELVASIREAGFYTKGRSQEIAGAVEQLSSGTQEMTATLSRLTGEASQHSVTIQEVNARMGELGAVARDLARGAETATERSRQLRGIAEESRALLRDGRTEVGQMAARSETATSRLLEFMDASRQFDEFVDLIKQFARRTNLLALNAAIEAARAGGEARGFAVLAEEIRKLASQAGEAADRVQETTDTVLGGLESARQAVGETRAATHAIGSVVESVDESFDAVTQAMSDAEDWAERVAQVSSDVEGSMRATAEQLSEVVAGFTDFAAAMEQLAAGMEEQNASTEEIAAAVSALSAAANELVGLADVFTLDELARTDVGRHAPQEKARDREVAGAGVG